MNKQEKEVMRRVTVVYNKKIEPTGKKCQLCNWEIVNELQLVSVKKYANSMGHPGPYYENEWVLKDSYCKNCGIRYNPDVVVAKYGLKT